MCSFKGRSFLYRICKNLSSKQPAKQTYLYTKILSITLALIEIATTDFTTTKAAVEGGADRIELCCSLSEGGITPSYGLIRQCREQFSLPLFPIIRPRGGDFLYTEEEWEIMVKDVLLCRQLQCDGVVIGALLTDGSVPKKWINKIVRLAYPMEVTFHRAFDRCRDPFEAMEDIIECGCQRILTSGQMPTAPEGADLIAQLINVANERIIIMPGSGVRKENIRYIKEKTGATEFHTSLRNTRQSSMQFVHPSFAQSEESYRNPSVYTEEIKALKEAVS